MSASSLPQYDLCFADGSRWVIAAADALAAVTVERLAAVMMLPAHTAGSRRLWVTADETIVFPAGDAVYTLPPLPPHLQDYVYFTGVSLAIARQAQTNGAVLLHGALAAYEQAGGVILAASGGTGKTTASGRFPPPWRSLCDDTTLVVCDAAGQFWAHPWPTWSRFLDDGVGGVWDTLHGVPLRALFFLKRCESDRVEPVGRGQAVTLLVQTAEQACRLMDRDQPIEVRRAAWLERFDNLRALAQAIPTFVLHISLEGAFWLEIEKAIHD